MRAGDGLMSRIEKALEKANKQRVEAGPAGPEPAQLQTVEKSASLAERLLPSAPLRINNPMLAALREKNDVVVEEYKKLRSLIVKLTGGDHFDNTLMVTSTVSGEGKTLTALNLAISLAKEYDHTVLLVDADLRRPSVHRYLGIEPEPGLIQCVKNQLPLGEALIKTGIGKLVVLPSGGTLDDPVEFLSSNRMKELIRELKTRYPDRYVIFDTPPMLPFADAQVLKHAVDATLFVVRERQAKIQHVKKILNDLKDANLLGVVYNDIQSCTANNPYYYY
jgi:exopolysaccharide/PEP-CTERM locus tyrosine autokinase